MQDELSFILNNEMSVIWSRFISGQVVTDSNPILLIFVSSTMPGVQREVEKF